MKWGAIIAAVIEGAIPFFGGLYAALLGFRVLGKKPGVSQKYDDWHKRFGLLLKVVGPGLMLFGLFIVAKGLDRADVLGNDAGKDNPLLGEWKEESPTSDSDKQVGVGTFAFKTDPDDASKTIFVQCLRLTPDADKREKDSGRFAKLGFKPDPSEERLYVRTLSRGVVNGDRYECVTTKGGSSVMRFTINGDRLRLDDNGDVMVLKRAR